jgi:hypothetical protein
VVIRTVDADTGLPLAGITVQPLRSDFGAGVKRYLHVLDAVASKAAPGVTSISGLVAGEYIIELDDVQDPNSGYGRSYYPNAPTIEAASVLSIGSGVTQHLEAAVRKRRLLHVGGFIKIIEGAESEISVHLTKEGPGMIEVIGHAEISGSGPFQIAGISEGHYRLMAWSGAASTSDLTYDEAEIDVTDKDVTQVHLNLQKGLHVRGKMLYPDNFVVDHPPSITFSDVYRLKVGPSLHTDLRQDGSFQFDNVVRGTYWYIVSGVPDGLVINKVTYRDLDVTNSTISIDAPSSLAEFRIYTTQTFCLVSGYVKSPDDVPLPDVTVLVIPDPMPDSFDPLKLRTAKTDADGRFSLRVPLGDYRAEAISNAVAMSLRDIQMIQRNFSSGVKFTASSIAASLKLER